MYNNVQIYKYINNNTIMTNDYHNRATATDFRSVCNRNEVIMARTSELSNREFDRHLQQIQFARMSKFSKPRRTIWETVLEHVQFEFPRNFRQGSITTFF